MLFHLAELLDTHTLDTDFFGKLVVTLIVILGGGGAAKLLFFRKPSVDVELAKLAIAAKNATREVEGFGKDVKDLRDRLAEGDAQFAEMKVNHAKLEGALREHVAKSDTWRLAFDEKHNELRDNIKGDIHEVKQLATQVLAKMTSKKEKCHD